MGHDDTKGYSEEKTGLFGDKYTEHRNADYEVEGRSEEKTDLFADKYIEHRNAEHEVIGRSEEKTGLFGDKYIEHRNAEHEVDGRSEEKTGLFGDKYTEHRGTAGLRRRSSKPDSDQTRSADSDKVKTADLGGIGWLVAGIALLFAFIFILAFAVITFPVWLGATGVAVVVAHWRSDPKRNYASVWGWPEHRLATFAGCAFALLQAILVYTLNIDHSGWLVLGLTAVTALGTYCASAASKRVLEWRRIPDHGRWLKNRGAGSLALGTSCVLLAFVAYIDVAGSMHRALGPKAPSTGVSNRTELGKMNKDSRPVTNKPEAAIQNKDETETRVDNAAALKSLDCGRERAYASPNGISPAADLELINSRSEPVQVYWLNQNGTRVLYQSLYPGQGYTQATYAGHPWVVSNNDGRCLSVFIPTAGKYSVRIR